MLALKKISVLITWIILFTNIIIPIASATGDEDIFHKALSYTAKIKTSISVPFFGEKKGSFIGAGFVVDKKRRWIMTNAHVAARSPSHVMVAFHNSDYQKATKIYVDPYLDLAILEVKNISDKTTETTLLCEDLPLVGHPVGAFGHPWKLSFTGTRGIISGITSQSKLRIKGEMLQTDAPINHGNSGGPLISLKTGHVVGINTASISHRKDQNTNFAVPIKYACRVLDLLKSDIDPSPPKLPVLFFIDLDEKKQLTVAKTYLDDEMIPIQEGDIIHEVVGVSDNIQNEGHLVNALRGRLNNIQLGVTRKGKRMVISGKLEPAELVTERRGVYISGILFGNSPYRDGCEWDLESTLLVHHVEPGFTGESLEVEQWDTLVAVDGMPIHDIDRFSKYVIQAQQLKRNIVVKLRRISAKNDRIYEYLERVLPIEDMKFYGKRKKYHLAYHK